MEAWVNNENREARKQKTRGKTFPPETHSARNHRLDVGRAHLSSDKWNARPGSRDPLRLHGKHAAHRRPLDHEPRRLRCRCSLHELARTPMAQSQAPAARHL